MFVDVNRGVGLWYPGFHLPQSNLFQINGIEKNELDIKNNIFQGETISFGMKFE